MQNLTLIQIHHLDLDWVNTSVFVLYFVLRNRILLRSLGWPGTCPLVSHSMDWHYTIYSEASDILCDILQRRTWDVQGLGADWVGGHKYHHRDGETSTEACSGIDDCVCDVLIWAFDPGGAVSFWKRVSRDNERPGCMCIFPMHTPVLHLTQPYPLGSSVLLPHNPRFGYQVNRNSLDVQSG